MKGGSKLPGPEWGVLAFCAWQSADLLTSWRHSPYDRLGWIALALWLVPALLATIWLRGASAAPRPTALAWLALACGLGGLLVDFTFPKYGGLALAIAAVTPRFRLGLAWFALSVAWMPGLGWLLAGLPPPSVMAARMALGCAATLVGVIGLRRENPGQTT